MNTGKRKTAEAIDVTELQHKDHQKVRDMFFKFNELEKGDEKENLVKEILTELYVHLTAEEEVVYAATEKKVNDSDDLMDESNTEHHTAKFLMAELSQMSADDDLYDAKVTVLAELVDHHVREEEKELFKKLRESDLDLEDLGARMQEREDELKDQPIPDMSASLSIGSKAPAQLKPKAKKQKKTA